MEWSILAGVSAISNVDSPEYKIASWINLPGGDRLDNTYALCWLRMGAIFCDVVAKPPLRLISPN